MGQVNENIPIWMDAIQVFYMFEGHSAESLDIISVCWNILYLNSALTLTLNSRSSLKEVEMSEFVLVPVLLLAFCSYVTLHLSPVDTPTLFLLVCSYPLAFILLFYVFSYFHPFFFGLVFLLHTARDILLLLTYLSV